MTRSSSNTIFDVKSPPAPDDEEAVMFVSPNWPDGDADCICFVEGVLEVDIVAVVAVEAPDDIVAFFSNAMAALNSFSITS